MIALLVHMTVKPGTEAECKELLKAVSEETRKEPGCIQYAAHQSQENPLHFLFYETYRDQSALDVHRLSPHYLRYVTSGIDHLVATRTKELFTPVS
ncbi:MAG: putative quinol monooxygenase [Acidobacteriota bacterium]|nr:putative quinol monooxygenase [Acidobacteriota bacterium]